MDTTESNTSANQRVSSIVSFHFGAHEVPVHLDNHGEPWWVAKTVCDILGLTQINRAMARLKPHEKGDTRVMTPGGMQTMRTVSESGLYRLVFRSDKPEAEDFRTWVFEEVLPQIRKTGKYGTPLPVVKNPSNQLLIEAIVRIDTLEQAQEAQREALLAQQAELIATQQKVIEGFLLAEQANTKADVALEDAHRMTIEEYIVKNGLVRQYPPSECRRMALWLKNFCEQWGIEVHQVPVIAKNWDTENAYPLEAFAAFFRYSRKRPKQITLVKEKDDGHT